VENSRKALEFKSQLSRKRTDEVKTRLALFEADKAYRETPKK
jgi:hypothetical protein